MQKKKILFVNHSLHSGGIEKSLVTLLNLFDYDRYEVDLQLFVRKGLFLDNVPSQVNQLPPLLPDAYGYNIREGFWAMLKAGMFRKAICRLLISLCTRSGSLGARMARIYRIDKQILRRNPKHYDAVIAFMEGEPLYYAVDKIDADRKIGFIHGDYLAMKLNKDFDQPFFEKLDALCTVSQGCKDALDRAFPASASRHFLVYNILSERLLSALAESGEGFADGFDGKRILTIARLSPQKGLDIGMEAIAALNMPNVKWYIIGIGPLEETLKAQAIELGIADRVVFLGETANPYPYLKACDVYFQPSRFEGKAIAVDEACIFKKPMVLGAYSTAADQIEADREGLICPLEREALAEGLCRLFGDSALCAQFSAALAQKPVTNESEIEKLYSIIENA